MKPIEKLLENNKTWAKNCIKNDPLFFENLVNIQNPNFLWIGCSDARVPANTLAGLKPGEVFVHRNVGNQIVHSDLNCLTVIEFAVKFLKVKDIIVCGHYGCAAVKGALENKRLGLIDNWLRHIKDLSDRNKIELEKISDPQQRFNQLCEINIHQQVINVCNTSSVQEAWDSGQDISVHGIVYDLHDGLLKELDLCISSKEDLQKIS